MVGKLVVSSVHSLHPALSLERAAGNVVQHFITIGGAASNWLIGSQYNIGDTFEITPSSAVGGTTFSTPAMIISGSGKGGIGTASPGALLHIKRNDSERRK